MRGLLLIALGVFVLFLVVTGRLKRFPLAWGYLVDGAFTDALTDPLMTSGGGGAAVAAMQGRTAGAAGGTAPVGISSGGLTLPKLPTLPKVGAWPSTGGKPPTGIEAPPMSPIPWPKGGPNGGIDPNTGKPWKF